MQNSSGLNLLVNKSANNESKFFFNTTKKNSFTMIEFLLPVTGPPFPALFASKPVFFAATAFLDFYLNCLAHFLSSVPVAFSPANKKYFICSKSNYNKF